eukprot:4523953-Prymnesium_polylepis.1
MGFYDRRSGQRRLLDLNVRGADARVPHREGPHCWMASHRHGSARGFGHRPRAELCPISNPVSNGGPSPEKCSPS